MEVLTLEQLMSQADGAEGLWAPLPAMNTLVLVVKSFK